MTVLNDLDRFHLVLDVLDRVPTIGEAGASLRQMVLATLDEHRRYIRVHGEDLPQIREWRWEAQPPRT